MRSPAARKGTALTASGTTFTAAGEDEMRTKKMKFMVIMSALKNLMQHAMHFPGFSKPSFVLDSGVLGVALAERVSDISTPALAHARTAAQHRVMSDV